MGLMNATIEPVMQARGLSKRFKSVQALERLNLQVLPGEIYCLLGANGAGKTTTVKLFLGFLTPTEGEALVGGREVGRELAACRSQITYIPEQVRLYPNLTGLENLTYLARLGGLPHERGQLSDLLTRAGLASDSHHRLTGEYSKGMRQKVVVALALARQSRLLLLDEPTSGLDPKAAAEFGELVCLLAGRGAAVFMVTHDLFRAREVGHRIGIMRSGKLVDELVANQVDAVNLQQIYLEHMRGL